MGDVREELRRNLEAQQQKQSTDAMDGLPGFPGVGTVNKMLIAAGGAALGGLGGRLLGRGLMRGTAKSEQLAAAAAEGDAAASAELKALKAEHEALATRLDDEADGKIPPIPPEERERMIARAQDIAWTNHPFGNMDPASMEWGMSNPHLKQMYEAEKALKDRVRLGGRLGAAAGAATGGTTRYRGHEPD